MCAANECDQPPPDSDSDAAAAAAAAAALPPAAAAAAADDALRSRRRTTAGAAAGSPMATVAGTGCYCCCCGSCTPLSRVIISLCVGLLLCIMGVVSYTTFPSILEQQVNANLVIDPSNEVYESWKESPIPIYAKMYLFNYTNPNEVIEGERPKLQQLGPFVYRERRHKVNITFNGNGTVSYRQVVSYEFLPHLSRGTLDDSLYTLNVPLIGTAYRNRKYLPDEQEPMAASMEEAFQMYNQSLIIHRKVRELLFEGYEDPMLRIAKTMGWSPFSRFGYQIGRNNSNDGLYTIFTGSNGMDKYGTVESWQGRQKVTGFRKFCNFVNGTSGEMWPPYTLTTHSHLNFFAPALCRSLRLDFLRNETVKGIRVLRYHMDVKLLDYSIEENQCFCSKKKGKEPECFPNGVLDLNKCLEDAPLVASLPHFLYTAPAVSDAVDGLQSEPDQHEFFMDVEPTMGIPLRVSARLQMNVIVDAFKYFSRFSVFKKRAFFPTFWIETSATISDELAFRIRLVTEDLANYVTVAAFAWVGIGLLVIMGTLGYVIAHTRSSVRRFYASAGYDNPACHADCKFDNTTIIKRGYATYRPPDDCIHCLHIANGMLGLDMIAKDMNTRLCCHYVYANSSCRGHNSVYATNGRRPLSRRYELNSVETKLTTHNGCILCQNNLDDSGCFDQTHLRQGNGRNLDSHEIKGSYNPGEADDTEVCSGHTSMVNIDRTCVDLFEENAAYIILKPPLTIPENIAYYDRTSIEQVGFSGGSKVIQPWRFTLNVVCASTTSAKRPAQIQTGCHTNLAFAGAHDRVVKPQIDL